MYKCSECGAEYETAPKYCDCGNDIFIPSEDIELQEIDNIFDEDEDDENEIPKRRNLKQKSFSPVSMTVFLLCIILSLLVLFVFGNPKKSIVENVVNNTEEKTEIPDIDSFWDDTAIKTDEPEQPQEQDNSIMNIVPKIVQQIIPAPKAEVKTDVTIKKTPVKSEEKIKTKPITTQNTQTQKNTNTQTKQTAQTTSSAKTNSAQVMTFEDLTNKIKNQYPVNQIPNTASSTASNTNTKTTQTQTAPKTVNSMPQNTSAKTTSPQTTVLPSAPSRTQTNQTVVQQTTAPVAPAKSAAQLRQELLTYKSNLRNLIGKKIDFTKVIGDGECTLSFKINSNGRLYSKAFLKQSSNITLNDAAFNALNTTTTYNPPPESYSGETLKLTIKFYNGNFEISLN